VSYRGTPDDGLILRDNVHGAPAAFVDNWPNRTRFWMPSVDHPADKATVRYTLHAPAHWRVVANGHLAAEPAPAAPDALGPASASGDRRTWLWEVTVPISTYNMVFGGADMVVESVGTAACGRAPASQRADGCVDVTYWVFPEDADFGARVFRRAAEMVDFFTDLVGPFPFEKLANVQSATRFGGMENASAIFYTERGIADGRLGEGTVSHEIAHQWFGDAVTQADWHHVWLSEGFATYFGHLFFEEVEGPEDFRRRMEESRRSYLSSDVVDLPIINHDEDDIFRMLSANTYPKGGWVLHMLRGMLGDDVFFTGIRQYYRQHLHSAVLSEDLQAAMEAVSGRDLEWFFHQWLHLPGYPVFEVEHRWVPDPSGSGGSEEITVRQVQKQAWPRFRMPMALVVESGGERTHTRVEVAGEVSVFRVPLDAPARAVLLDPDGWVLKGG
jgi:aminopeptidase N